MRTYLQHNLNWQLEKNAILNRQSINVSCFLIVLVILTGCSRATPLTFEEIPLYGSTKTLSEDDVLAAPLVESLRQSTGLENMEVETLVLNLTGDSSWTRIQNHYAAIMEGINWELSEDYTKESKYVSAAGWARSGIFSEQQVLIVSRMEDPLGGSPYLMLILFTR